MLTDFIPQETFLSPAPQPQRNPYRVCYNPKKGAKILARVREALGSTFEWLPLEGMDREEVGNALHGAGISLDLGHHPGKDRMPREAALAGALTIVSRTGSGAFEADVPLPWEHKFPLDPAGIARLIDQLPKLASQLAQEIRKQDPYRKAIAREHVRFRQEVEDIFLRRRYGQGPH